MEKERVVLIIEGLANGLDPITGEVLPPSSPYNHPEVIRALFIALQFTVKAKGPKKTIEQKQQDNIDKGLPKNYGLPWTEADINKVIACYQADKQIDLIAEEFERKPSSIVSLLQKHGAITEETAIFLNSAFK